MWLQKFVLGECSEANAALACYLAEAPQFPGSCLCSLKHDKVQVSLVKITPLELCPVSLIQLGKDAHCEHVVRSLSHARVTSCSVVFTLFSGLPRRGII